MSPPVFLSGLRVSSPRDFLAELKRRPVLMLFLANLFAQVFSVALAPLLSRLYSPRDFGLLGALNAVVMICVPLATWRYELAIPRAASERASFTMLHVCMWSIATMTVCFAGTLLMVRHTSVATWAQGLLEYWYLMPLGTAAVAFYDTLAMEASRRKELTVLASSKLTQAGLGMGTQVALGLLGTGSAGLLIGFLLNQVAGTTQLFKTLVLKHPARASIRWSEVRAAAWQHRDFPLYTGSSAALDSCSQWALQLALSTLWDPFVGGYVFLAERLIGRPLLLVSTSLLPVYVFEVSQAMRSDPRSIPRIFRASLRTQALVSLAWTVAVVILAPQLIEPLFGAEWRPAVHYVQVMSIAIAAVYGMHSVSFTLQLAARQRLESTLVVARVLAISVALVGCHVQGLDALSTLEIFAAVQVGFALLRVLIYARVVAEMAAAPKVYDGGASEGAQHLG